MEGLVLLPICLGAAVAAAMIASIKNWDAMDRMKDPPNRLLSKLEYQNN